jgi:hypothetical protein
MDCCQSLLYNDDITTSIQTASYQPTIHHNINTDCIVPADSTSQHQYRLHHANRQYITTTIQTASCQPTVHHNINTDCIMPTDSTSQHQYTLHHANRQCITTSIQTASCQPTVPAAVTLCAVCEIRNDLSLQTAKP